MRRVATIQDEIMKLVQPFAPADVLLRLYLLLDEADTAARRDILTYTRSGGMP